MNLRWKIAQYFEARWWRSYLRGKSPEGYLQWKRAYWVGFLEKIGLDLPKGQVVLDAGCGPAGIFLVLDDCEVTALDPLLSKYRGMFPHFAEGALPHTRFVEQPLEQFTASQKFDLVFCLNAINHMAELQLCLRNLRSATLPGGRLVLSVDAHNYLFFKHLFQLFPGDVLHPHQYSLNDYEGLLRKNGFEVESSFLLKREFFFSYFVLVLR